MEIKINVSRDKALKCSQYILHVAEEYSTKEDIDDDVYFGLNSIAKQLGKAVKKYDKVE